MPVNPMTIALSAVSTRGPGHRGLRQKRASAPQWVQWARSKPMASMMPPQDPQEVRVRCFAFDEST